VTIAEALKLAEERHDEGSLISFVDEEFKRRRNERIPWELQWRLNVAFIEGNQFMDINPAAQSLQEIPKIYFWQEREPFNQIAPIVETRIARMSRMRPVLKARPGTNSMDDIRSAKVSTHLLRNFYYEEQMQQKMGELYAWLEAMGSVFMKNIWNPERGELIGLTEFMFENNGEEGQYREEIREGDLEAIIVPAPEIFPDSCYRNNMESVSSIIHARAFHVDEIEDTWGIRVEPEESAALKLQRASVGIGGLGYGVGGYNYLSVRLKDHAVVKEYWQVPSKRYPRGRLIIVANGKLLYFGHLPYPVGKDGKYRLPFTKVDCIKRPGVFWGKTIVERLIPIQRRYNALRNRKAEYMNRCAIGQYWVEEESTDMDILENNIGSPGFIGTYAHGSRPPEPAQNPPLPATFDIEESSLMQEFNVLSGVSDLSRQSKAPPGVKSGVALSIALEQDDTRLSKTASNVETFLIENGKMWLRLYKAFAKGIRTLRTIGENNVVEVIDWTGSDITSDDVVVEAFSAMAESPAQRRQMVFDLLATGLFHDPETGRIDKDMRSKIFEMIELGSWEIADSTEQLHIARAERENIALAQGQMAQVVPYDDHVLHLSCHNKYRITAEYEELARQYPQLEQMFQAHTDQHLMHMMPQMGPPGGLPAMQGGGPPNAAYGGAGEGYSGVDAGIQA